MSFSAFHYHLNYAYKQGIILCILKSLCDTIKFTQEYVLYITLLLLEHGLQTTNLKYRLIIKRR